MGRRNKGAGGTVAAASFSEALLFTTMCIVGLPVEVQVKDGSVYSGIFHTASVENDYDIVLKKAKMIQKGTTCTNMARGSVDTLVVHSGDLVQVVAKGVPFPTDDSIGDVEGALMDSAWPGSLLYGETKNDPARSFEHNNGTTRVSDVLNTKIEGISEQAEGALGSSKATADEKPNSSVMGKTGWDKATSTQTKKAGHKVRSSTSKTNIKILDAKLSAEQMTEKSSDPSFKMDSSVFPSSSVVSHEATAGNMPHHASQSSAVHTMKLPLVSTTDIVSSSCPSRAVSPSGPVSNSKEFKLNPAAKTFLPSYTSSRTVPLMLSTSRNLGYVQSSSSMGPVPSAQAGVEMNPFAPRASLPVKFVEYNNVVAGNSGRISQYSVPISGHMGFRQQTLRYGCPYPIPPAYVQPNHPQSQPVMLGRLGQVVCVHPSSQDVNQGAAALSHGPQSQSVLVSPHLLHLSKSQGVAALVPQLSMGPSFIATVPPPIAVSSNMQSPQSVPLNRPVQMMVPAVTGVFGSKFP